MTNYHKRAELLPTWKLFVMWNLCIGKGILEEKNMEKEVLYKNGDGGVRVFVYLPDEIIGRIRWHLLASLGIFLENMFYRI